MDKNKEAFCMKNSLYAYITVILSGLFLCPPSLMAEDFTVNGYQLSMVNLVQENDELKISGRLEYGDYCRLLKLSVRIQSDQGKNKTIVCNVKNAGQGSSIFEGRSGTRKKSGSSWTIVDIRTKCMDK